MSLKLSTALLTEQAARKAVPAFTKIHGHPSRGHRNILREEVLKALGIVDMPDTDHRLIGELTKTAEYRRITGEEEEYEEMDKPLPYDEDIDHDNMSPEEVKMAEAQHLQLLTMWHVRKGTLLGVGDQIRKALDQKYHKRLEKKIIGYKNVTIRQYFEHLDQQWCSLETHVVKELKAHALRGWQRLEEDEDLGGFAKRLEDDVACLKEDKISISEEDMLQHFMEQILESGLFDEKDVREFNMQDNDDKDWENTVEHWEKTLNAMELFNRSAGGTAKKARFESETAAYITEAIQMAKEEAVAEDRAEYAQSRRQGEEEATALINLLQGQKDDRVQESTASSNTIQAVLAVQEDMKKEIALLKRQNKNLSRTAANARRATTATQPAAPKKEPAATPSDSNSKSHALNSAG